MRAREEEVQVYEIEKCDRTDQYEVISRIESQKALRRFRAIDLQSKPKS